MPCSRRRFRHDYLAGARLRVQHGWKEYYRGTEVLLNMVSKVKFEIICDDAEVDALIDVISATARTGNGGDGKIFVFPVDEVVRIRTGERGDEAI